MAWCRAEKDDVAIAIDDRHLGRRVGRHLRPPAAVPVLDRGERPCKPDVIACPGNRAPRDR